jgi:hypothetical protein
VTFETEKSLVVHRTHLLHLHTLDPGDDRYEDHREVLSANEKNESMTFQPFVGTLLIPHRLHVAQDMLFQIHHPTTVTLEFTLSAWDAAYESFFRKNLRWKTWDGDKEKDITPPASGVSANAPGATITVTFGSALVTKIVQKPVATEKQGHFWIWGETKEKLSFTEAKMQIKSIGVKTEADGIPAEAAFFNTLPLDPMREMYPFGDRPKLYDTFFFAVPEVFVRAGSTITIIPEFTPGSSTASGGVTLTWDFWDGKVWRQVGASNSAKTPPAGAYAFSDTTMGFTQTKTAGGAPATIEFTCPPMALADVNGKKNHWLRARITGGHYGEEAKLAPKKDMDRPSSLEDWVYEAPTYMPPILASLRVSYRYEKVRQPTALRTENNFALASPSVGSGFSPFVAPGETRPALYFGFDRAFASRPVSLFIAVEESLFTTPPSVVWEYSDGTTWKNLGVQDGTANLTESGTVEFIGPADARAEDRFGVFALRFWIRAWLEGGDKRKIGLLGAYLNTVWAKNCTTVRNEPLGSSSEKPNAELTLSRFPVLEGVMIEVREPDRPNEDELALLRDEEGEEVLQPAGQGQAFSREYWVRWHRVEDFRFSEKTSRHFTIDWSTGKIRFGDGKKGMIPPAGRDNIRAAGYQAGGGARGTAARNAVTVMKRSIPFVEKAFNVDRAGGGSDAETVASVMVRGPQTLKNRDRAVTWEDYEWLAKEASLQVARARCLPAKSKEDAGTVRLIIVPLSDEPQPLPSQGLIRQVKDYLNTRERRIGTANLSVSEPKYVSVSVEAKVFPEKLEEADLVRRRVMDNLTDFFHPLFGGPEKTGWEFGRHVFVSEVCKVIEDTEGVHHAENVALSSETLGLAHRDSIPVPDNALVASGGHSVTLVSTG